MVTLQLSPELAKTIEHEATSRNLTIEQFIQTMLVRERTLTHRRRIEQEQAWWLSRPLSERAAYEGQFVAVHQQRLVDHDTDDATLQRRVREKFGQQPVLIMPAEGPTELRIFSPSATLEAH